MKIVYAVCALLLLAAFAPRPAEAKGKGKVNSGKKLYDINWGRRTDLNTRWWPLHQGPYVKF